MPIEHVLVTGAGGFIGSNLVDDQLARGRKLTALDINLRRLDHLRGNSRCTLVEGDIRDIGLLNKVVDNQDVIFHLASAHLEVNESDSYFEAINVDAVTHLARIASEKDISRFVHCSSVGVYGPLESLPADETTTCNPDIAYEVTKLKGEAALRKFAGQLPYVILRPSWVYGPRCLRTLKLLRTLKSKRFFKVGNKQTYRHPIYISDMLDAFDIAAQHPAAVGETFIIGGEDPVLLDTLIHEITLAQGSNFRPITVPLSIMTPACFGVEKLFALVGKEPPFSRRSLKFFTESSAFDISKAKDILGYSPKVDLASGLKLTNEYFETNDLL